MKSLFYTAQCCFKLLLVLILVAFSSKLSAQQASLTVQGVLTKADGTAVDDDVYTLTFRLWNHPDATDINTNRKHIETINNVETVGGVYTVILGVNGTPLTAAFDEVYYLGVSINTSTIELLPRPRLTHAPYALGIKGQNNTFPSTGPVIGDAFRAKGGPAQGGLGPTANGYSFQTPSGDDAGGMFSAGANNISIYAGGSQKAKFSSGLNELIGQTNTNALTVFGTLTSNDHTINGTSLVNGGEIVTGDERVQGNQLCNHKFLTKSTSDGGGYSFEYDGAFDTGLFGTVDGTCRLVSNGTPMLELVSPNEIALGPGIPIAAQLRIFSNEVFVNTNARFFNNVTFQNLPPKPGGNINPKNIAFDLNNGLLFWENSSRRFKHNIRPLEDNFSLILKAQPRIYNRYVDGVKDTLYTELGYIAEEMDSIGLHQLVQRDKDGLIDGFDYEKMILYTVEVLKIQDAAIQNLTQELAALKAANAGLQTKNNTLQADNGTLMQIQTNMNAQLESLSKRMYLLETTDSGNSKK